MRARGLAVAVLVGLAAVTPAFFGGCAATSAGDCSDKGVCPSVAPSTVVDASAADAGVVDRARDAQSETRDAAEPSDGAAADALAPDDGRSDAPVADVDAPDAPAPCEVGACVEAPPPGFRGPLTLDEAVGRAPASCVAPYGDVAYEGGARPSSPPAACGCACGAPSDVTCGAPTVDLYAGASCSARCGGASVPTGACAPVSTAACGGAIYARASAVVASGGSCAPKATVTLPAWGWGTSARACALPAPAQKGRCEGARVCAPSPTAPFTAHLCVAIAGDASCPSGSAYSVRHVYYESVADGRACTACTCASPTGATCDGGVSVFNTGTCALPTTSIALASACTQIQIATASLTSAVALASGGTCAPSPTTPTGAVIPGTPTTVCCMP